MVSRRRFPGIWSNIWLRSALDLRKSQGAAPFISIPLRSFFGPQNPIKSEEKLIWYFKQIMFKYIYKSVYTNHSTSIFPWKHGTVQVFSSAQRTSTGKTSPLCGHSRPGTPRAETGWDWWLGSSKYRKKKRWAKTAEVMGQQLRKRMGQDASIQFLILGESGMFLQNCLRKNNCWNHLMWKP